jgi:hypothetical protein
VFGNLGDGTPPPGEKVVEVWAEPKCECDDCGCHDDEASQIRLEYDGVSVGAPCPAPQCEFTVVLTPGTHTITAIARYSTGETSSSIQIQVPGDGGSSESGMPPADDDATAGGCGCRTADRPVAWLLVAGALGRRRARNGATRARGAEVDPRRVGHGMLAPWTSHRTADRSSP